MAPATGLPHLRLMTAPVAVPEVTAASRVGLPELSIVADGDEYVVGDPATGQFVSLPPIGVTALRALAADQTVGAAAIEVSAAAGEDVNLVEFVQTMIGFGLVLSIDGRPVRATGPVPRSRLTGIRPERARLLFGKSAWACYAVLTVFSIAVLAAAPEYRPAFEDYLFFPNPAACIGCFFVLSMGLAMVHEYWHWLGARALGVRASISFSRRAFFLVLQTDLSMLWSLPRSRRLGPLAAGMAFDFALLGVALALRVAATHAALLPPLADRFMAALVLRQVIVIVFQLLVCLRTDGYLLLTTLLGCRDLLATTKLHVRSALFGLSPRLRARLDGAPARDRRVARWYGPVFVVAVGVVTYLFINLWLPGVAMSSAWMFYGLAGAPFGSAAFVQAAIPATVLLVQVLAPVAVAIRDRVRKRGS